VTPTEAGKLLLEHGRGILHQVARTYEELGRVRGALAGRVGLGLPPSMARALTVPITREFRKRLPNAALSVSEGLSIAMREGLLTGRLDVALLYNPLPSAELDTAPLMTESLFLIGRREPSSGGTDAPDVPDTPDGAAPRALREVALLPLVIPSRPNAIRMLVEQRMAEIGCRPNIALEIDGVAAILDLVLDGAGFAVLPTHALGTVAQPLSFVMRPIAEPALRSNLVIATAARRPATLTQQALVALVRDVAASVFADVVRR
jgi:LysR family nitrogen assimilation transcriptional regulator